MVVLSHNFAVLASLSALAAMSLVSAPANAVAVPGRHNAASPKTTSNNQDSSSNSQGAAESTSVTAVLPLPRAAKRHMLRPVHEPEPKPFHHPTPEDFHKVRVRTLLA